MIKVLFFGPVAERVGIRELQMPHKSGMRLQDLRDQLAQKYPGAFGIVCLSALDGEHVHDMNTLLKENSEVAFMAKYSGG